MELGSYCESSATCSGGRVNVPAILYVISHGNTAKPPATPTSSSQFVPCCSKKEYDSRPLKRWGASGTSNFPVALSPRSIVQPGTPFVASDTCTCVSETSENDTPSLAISPCTAAAPWFQNSSRASRDIRISNSHCSGDSAAPTPQLVSSRF